jgi:hypothetical protein
VLFRSIVPGSHVVGTVTLHHDIRKERSFKLVFLFLANNVHEHQIILIKWGHLTSSDISLMFK